RAQKNRALLDDLLEVLAPQETRPYARDGSGWMLVLVQQSVDEQYAAAFRRWGLDVDGTAEAEEAQRLRQEPDGGGQELIVGPDAWAIDRRLQGIPEARWRHLSRVADRLDGSDQRRQLRAVLVEGSPPRAETVAALVGGGSPWPALWELARGNAWRRLREV